MKCRSLLFLASICLYGTSFAEICTVQFVNHLYPTLEISGGMSDDSQHTDKIKVRFMLPTQDGDAPDYSKNIPCDYSFYVTAKSFNDDSFHWNGVLNPRQILIFDEGYTHIADQ